MSRLPSARMLLSSLLILTLSCLALGCGGEKTYRLSGKVTFKGQPIPLGKIYFIPDDSKGNKGPSGYADIKDGNYDTDATGGSGSVGGPMIVRIHAVDPSVETDKGGKMLFPTYQTTLDLPKADGTKDIDVPADAVKGSQKSGGPGGGLVPKDAGKGKGGPLGPIGPQKKG